MIFVVVRCGVKAFLGILSGLVICKGVMICSVFYVELVKAGIAGCKSLRLGRQGELGRIIATGCDMSHCTFLMRAVLMDT